MSLPDRSSAFRERLNQIIDRSGLNHATFARRAGFDRSTLAQLLDKESRRLPRAETLVTIAAFAGVSIDWLLGISQREEVGAKIVETVLRLESQVDSPADDRWLKWTQDATGTRVRTVPATFPDFLKTPEVLRYEYAEMIGANASISIEQAHERLALLRRPENELEACVALERIETFAAGSAQWKGLRPEARRAALLRMAELIEELYPSLRVYLYGLRNAFSAPFTVFGQQQVAIYLGSHYLVLSGVEHIRTFSQRYDTLIRAAVVQPHEAANFIRELPVSDSISP
jgi:transcriptional regulator with XRE-family HTH domain